MKKLTFKNINHIGQVVFENALYKHVHNPELLVMYDCNFIEFKRMPSVAEFRTAENYLRDFHLKNGQKHLKFYFPDNEKVTSDLMVYLNELGYEVGFLELYAIDPNNFTDVKNDLTIEIHQVSKETLESYMKLQYENDIKYGIEFAKQKSKQYIRNFEDNQMMQLIAFYEGKPAGSVDVIITEDIAEIDSLSVVESFQKKGIGSSLQKFAMNQFSNKTVILVADGEDTPRDMYKKQNYEYLGFRYEVLKVY